MLRITKYRKFTLSVNPKFIHDVEKIFKDYVITYRKMDFYKPSYEDYKLPKIAYFMDCEIELDNFESLCERLEKIPTKIGIRYYS